MNISFVNNIWNKLYLYYISNTPIVSNSSNNRIAILFLTNLLLSTAVITKPSHLPEPVMAYIVIFKGQNNCKTGNFCLDLYSNYINNSSTFCYPDMNCVKFKHLHSNTKHK